MGMLLWHEEQVRAKRAADKAVATDDAKGAQGETSAPSGVSDEAAAAAKKQAEKDARAVKALAKKEAEAAAKAAAAEETN